jgi:hypothetical protein
MVNKQGIVAFGLFEDRIKARQEVANNQVLGSGRRRFQRHQPTGSAFSCEFLQRKQRHVGSNGVKRQLEENVSWRLEVEKA